MKPNTVGAAGVLALAVMIALTGCAPDAAPPTATEAPPSATDVPPTATAVPPTATAVPPTATATAVPPTATPRPTATEAPPTATATIAPVVATRAPVTPATVAPVGLVSPFAPGLYRQRGACANYSPAIFPFLKVTWCVESVRIYPDGVMEFNVIWIADAPPAESAAPAIKKSDDGNRSMYLIDSLGYRHDHHLTTGAARTGGQAPWGQVTTMTGAFLFVAPPPGVRSFVFHDDDQGVVIGNIVFSNPEP